MRLALSVAAALAAWHVLSLTLTAPMASTAGPSASSAAPSDTAPVQSDWATGRSTTRPYEARPSCYTNAPRPLPRPYPPQAFPSEAADAQPSRSVARRYPVQQPSPMQGPHGTQRAHPMQRPPPVQDRRPAQDLFEIAPRRGALPPYSGGPIRPTSYVADPAPPGELRLSRGTTEQSGARSDSVATQPPPSSQGEAEIMVPAPQPVGQRAPSGEPRRAAPGKPEERVSQVPWNLLRQLPDIFSGEPTSGSYTRAKIPLARSIPSDAVQVDPRSGLVTIAIRDAPLDQVLGILAEQQDLNIICSEDVTARISITIKNAPFEEALAAILSVAGYTARRRGDFLLITSVSAAGSVSPEAQGREVRVLVLNYVSASDADVVIKGLLSPVGQSFAKESDDLDYRKTQELIVVEDLPAYLSRIEETVRQLDVPPRQVLIEAHILGVELEDDLVHGVNFSYLREANPAITLGTRGFADPAASPALIFDLTTSELAALVECLKTTTDAKTLASPKVFALNGQQARIQIGQQLGYRVVTTTQTSTMENVDFLEVGVILTVTPQITPDDCVLMNVKPVVSSGQINPDTKLPEEETTEVETSLILRDGHGIVIGGLIQEEDVEIQQKVPFIGDLWLVGRLFQRRQVDRKRTEIIVALIPHIVPYLPECYAREAEQFHRATTPVVYGPIQPYPRPWEPTLPDASQRPACFCRPAHWWPTTESAVDLSIGPPVQYYEEAQQAIPPAYYEGAPGREDVTEAGEALPGPIIESSR